VKIIIFIFSIVGTLGPIDFEGDDEKEETESSDESEYLLEEKKQVRIVKFSNCSRRFNTYLKV
jgi:hypothetical protein